MSRFARGKKLAMMEPKPEPVEAPPSSPVLINDDELMADVGKISINGASFACTEADVLILDELGEGQYGSVKKVRLKSRGVELAVKVMRDNIKPDERKNLVREINTIRRAQACPTIVDYYGLNFCEGDVWIYMELMEISLEKLYVVIGADTFPEDILAQYTVSIFNGLRYLKNELDVMHRDIKPSNTLKGFDGQFKICDFGISNNLEKSLLHTVIGCSPYLSPERINPASGSESYGVESDVWSFGLTIVELAKKKYPYDGIEDDKNIFSLLQAIVGGEPPTLPERYSADFQDFVQQCLIKERKDRPRYNQPPIGQSKGTALENHVFYQRVKDCVNPEAVRDWYAKYDSAE